MRKIKTQNYTLNRMIIQIQYITEILFVKQENTNLKKYKEVKCYNCYKKNHITKFCKKNVKNKNSINKILINLKACS